MAADVQRAHADAGASATEVLAGVRTVRAFSHEAEERGRYERQLWRALGFARPKVQARAVLGGVSPIAGECGALPDISGGGRPVLSGQMATGALNTLML